MEESVCKETHLLNSKYNKADIEAVVNNQTHLYDLQQEKLGCTLAEFEELFQGKIGAWNRPKTDIKLKENTTQFHGAPYKFCKQSKRRSRKK